MVMFLCLLCYYGRVFARVLHHPIESPLLSKQLVRVAFLDDSPLTHHQHLIIIGDRVQSVGNCHDCGVSEPFLEDLLDEVVSLHVYV